MEFSGRLASFPLGDVLQWTSQEARTGALVVRRSQREKRVYFVDGKIVACLSDDPFEYYGQFLLNHGYLREGELVKALTRCRQRDQRLGAVLREMGLMSPAEIQLTLRHLIEDLVCDLFLWRRGVFYFERETRPVDEILPEPIDAVKLALEGARWIDEYERMRSVFVHDNVVLRVGQVEVEELPALQAAVLRQLQGAMSLTELYHAVKGSYYRFLEATFALTVAGVIDIDSVGEEVAASSSMELRVADLLLEQAAEEQVLFSKQHLALPVDVVNRFCPVWVADPAAEERERMPRWAAELAAKIDGETRLEDVWSEDHTERHRQADFLVLQLRKGTLALLPESVEALEHRGGRAKGWLQRVFGRK